MTTLNRPAPPRLESADRLSRRIDHWLLSPAPPERLAALRIATGAFVTIYLLANVGEFARLAGRIGGFEPIGVARALDEPLSSTLVWVLFAGLLVSGSAFTLGVAYRVSGPVFAAGVLAWTTYHSSWGQLLHFEHLFTIHVIVLALSPAADAWTLSSPGRPRRTEPDTRYGWPVRMLALATAITYMLSGIAKLRLSGWSWFDDATLANHIGYSATRMDTIGGPSPPLARVVLEQRWLLPSFAVATLAVELGAPLALLGRLARNVWVVAALTFHAAAGATMLVFFGYRGLGFAMLPLFAVETWPTRVRERLVSRRRPAGSSR